MLPRAATTLGTRLVCAMALACLAAGACTGAPGVGTADEDRDNSSAQGRDARVTPAPDLVPPLERLEDTLRAAHDPRRPSSSTDLFGPDPIDAQLLPDGSIAVALQGEDAIGVWRIDDNGMHEQQRVAAPAGVRALAMHDAVLVAGGRRTDAIARYVVDIDGLRALPPLRIPGIAAVAALASSQDLLFVADDRSGDVVSVDRHGAVRGRIAVGPTIVDVRRVGPWLLALSVTGHRVVVARVQDDGSFDDSDRASLRIDGPLWSVSAALRDDGALLVFAGGVEDAPLDRSIGSFGHIDSFVYAWLVHDDGTSERIATHNVSDDGIVTPRALQLRGDELLVVGAGSGDAVRLRVSDMLRGADRVQFDVAGRLAVPAGITRLARGLPGDDAGDVCLGVDPLLDAIVQIDATGARVQPIVARRHDDTRTIADKLGEALMFTTLMAPAQRSDGALSRFTCETCHFEGGVDGRTHNTGRLDDQGRTVRATTKPLWGLLHDTPLFSRALDRNLSVMVHAEFRVANANSGLDPLFAVETGAVPWLADLGATGTWSPLQLREALLRQFARMAPPPDLLAHAQAPSSMLQLRGAALFSRVCASCHLPRLDAADATTTVRDDEVLPLLADAAIVWSGDRRVRTGVQPYVHEEGARPPSLRRLWARGPYFTNGSAHSVDDVLARVRIAPRSIASDSDATENEHEHGDGFLHDGERAGLRALTPGEQAALRAFLARL